MGLELGRRLAKLVEVGGRRRMGQQLHGGLVEEDPQVCPSFGSKHDVVADVRRLSLAHEAPRHPSATFALVLVVPRPVLLRTHPGLCGGTPVHLRLLSTGHRRTASPRCCSLVS